MRGTALASQTGGKRGEGLDRQLLSSSTGRMFPAERERSSAIAALREIIDDAPSGWCMSCRPDQRFVRGVVVVVPHRMLTRSAVLIFSEDPLAAALIGAAVELVGFEPMYPVNGESPRAALLRKRPPLILVDCDHEPACRPTFVGPALMTGARVVLLAGRTQRDPVAIAARFGLRSLKMPADLRSIASVLETELEAAGR